jgi:hypothetical protein
LGRVLIFGQILNDHRKERMWILPPLTTGHQPFTFGGTRINLAAAYSGRLIIEKKTWKLIFTTIMDFVIMMGTVVWLKRKYNPYNFGKFNVSIGRDFQFHLSG